MPVWLQNESAWIAIGVSLVFVVAGWVMHRVFLSILKNPAPASATRPNPPDTPNAEPEK
jgi:hypothetical protein